MDLARQFADARAPFDGVHLDSAAAGRSSAAVLSAVRQHLELEVRVGGYVAAHAMEPVLQRGRAQLGRLVNREGDELALMESATVAFTRLLAAWPLPAGSRVAVAPDEWGPNLELIAAAGLALVPLPVDEAGLVDVDSLDRMLRHDAPDVVQITQVPSHRPLVQPVDAIARVCAAAGVPLWVDAAQAIGQVAVPAGPAAVFAPGRKWLAGPRGSGLLAVGREWWSSLRLPATALAPDVPLIQRLESSERSAAVLVGLCVAVDEHLELGPDRVRTGLADVGRRTRAAMAGLRAWRVLPPAGGEVAITALEPAAGQDVGQVRELLRTEFGLLTTAAGPARAPRAMSRALLRISPHVDITDEDLQRLAAALASAS